LGQLGDLRKAMRNEGAAPREVISAAQSYLNEPEVARQIAPCAQGTCPLLHQAIASRAGN
jgi:hypothetical protein